MHVDISNITDGSKGMTREHDMQKTFQDKRLIQLVRLRYNTESTVEGQNSFFSIKNGGPVA